MEFIFKLHTFSPDNFSGGVMRPVLSTSIAINPSSTTVYRQINPQQAFRVRGTPPGTPVPTYDFSEICIFALKFFFTKGSLPSKSDKSDWCVSTTTTAKYSWIDGYCSSGAVSAHASTTSVRFCNTCQATTGINDTSASKCQTASSFYSWWSTT